MALTPRPSRATLAKWGRLAKHSIRIEIALLFIAAAMIVLSVGIAVAANAWGPGPASLWGRIFFHCDLWLVSFLLAWIHLGVFTNHSMNPVYTLCIDILMIILTSLAMWSWFTWDVNGIRELYGYYESSGGAGVGFAGFAREILGGVQGLLYLINMSLAARAVDNVRKGRKSGVKHIEETAHAEPLDLDRHSQYQSDRHSQYTSDRHSQYTAAPPPTYYTGSNVYAPSAFGTSVSSRPATIFSDLTTVKGDHLSTISERPMDMERVEDGARSLRSL